jgi:hypothetical protein
MIRKNEGTIRRRLTNEALFKLTHKNNLGVKQEISDALGVTIAGVQYMIRQNMWNGRLTTETVLLILEERLSMDRKDMLQLEIDGE